MSGPAEGTLMVPSDEEVWLRAWCAVANDHRVTSGTLAANWADSCLENFRKRFGSSASEKPT